MTGSSVLHAELPEGYRLREIRALARSTRKTWNDRWELDLRDLYLRGGFSWMLAGFGHEGSGVLRAIESRGMVEVADHPTRPLLVRLTPEGHRIGEATAEAMRSEETPPADAETVYRPTPRDRRRPRPTVQRIRPTVLTADDAHLLDVLRGELDAIEASVARFAEYEAAGEIADYEMRDRHVKRIPELRGRIAELAGSRS